MHDVSSNKLDLLLVNPSLDYEQDLEKILSRRIEAGTGNQESPHLGYAYIIANLRQHGLVADYVDMPVEQVSLHALLNEIGIRKPLVVGLSAYTIQIKTAAAIAAAIKQRYPEVLVCCGGPHVTVMPKETLEEFPAIDFIICGEAELLLLQIFEQLRSGSSLAELKGVVTRGKEDISYDNIQDLDALPFPAWDSFDLDRYPGLYPHRTRLELPVSTSRGCPFSCIFCVRPFGRKRRHRSVESVINEIKRNIDQFGCESISFVDETFIFDLEWSRKLFQAMIDEGINKKINWSCSTRVDNMTADMFKLMKEAGCYYVFFGFESGDDTMLKNMKKSFRVADIKRAVAMAKEARLIVVGSFIIGLPGETEATVKKSIELAKEMNIYSTTFPIAVPFPGTILRKQAENNEHGMKILTNNWDDYGKQYPGVMDSEALSMEQRRALQKLAYDMIPKKKLPDNYTDM